MGIYALVFVGAYTFDRSTYHGIIGAVAGLFLNYVVMIVVGFLTLRGASPGQAAADEANSRKTDSGSHPTPR